MEQLKVFIIATLVAIVFCGCGKETENNTKQTYFDGKSEDIFEGVNYQIVEIDSCEYIIGQDNFQYNGGFFLSHKGNCKFCAERSKNSPPKE